MPINKYGAVNNNHMQHSNSTSDNATNRNRPTHYYKVNYKIPTTVV